MDAFFGWVEAKGLTLYPHQEEALLEVVAGNHVIVDTPAASNCSRRSGGLSTRIRVAPSSTRIDGRVRRFRTSAGSHRPHPQSIAGVPLDPPEPRIVIRITLGPFRTGGRSCRSLLRKRL